MTTISSMPAYFGLTECDFVARALSSYDVADKIVHVLDSQKKANKNVRRENMQFLKTEIVTMENSLWEALARDFPKYRFRRQNQTIVVSYNSDSGTTGVSAASDGAAGTTVSSGEVSKIKILGANDYYEALDTINRLQNQLYNNGIVFNRRWKDDWHRLGKQLVIINRRNCKSFAEPIPGPIVVLPPPSIPKPPYLPGPDLPVYPLPPIEGQSNWSTQEARNWSIMGWTNSAIIPMAGNLQVGRPTIALVGGRELIYYAPNGINTTKLVWLFHDTNSSARDWFTDYEKVKYVKKLTDAGYAVAAYESGNRISRKWALTSNPLSNRDIVDLKACQDYLARANILKKVCSYGISINPQTGLVTNTENCTYTTPQFGVGMGIGGNFVAYVAKTLGLEKVILHNSTGVSQIIRNAEYNIPTVWMLSRNDAHVNNTEASNNYNYVLVNKPSVTVGFYIQESNKVTASIFDAIPGVGTDVATAIVSGLVSSGFINSDGSVTTKYTSANKSTRDTYLQNTIPGIISSAFGNDVANYRTYVTDIVDQLQICFSDHEFSGWQRNADGTLVDRDLAFLG